MIRVSKRGTAVAVLVAAAIAAPSASASPAETLLPSASNAGADAVGAPFAPQTQAVEAPEDSGFDWGDAGIGAAGALSLLSLGAGAVVIARRSRSSHPAIG